MYTFSTRVTNQAKHARQIPWLGIPADWFQPGESREVPGVYPMVCMSRKSQFDYEVEQGLVAVTLITDMPVETPKAVVAKPAPKPAPAKPAAVAELPKVSTAQPGTTGPLDDDPLKRLAKNSGIRVEKMGATPEEILDRKLEPEGLPPATTIFSTEEPLQNKPSQTMIIGDKKSEAAHADSMTAPVLGDPSEGPEGTSADPGPMGGAPATDAPTKGRKRKK